VRARLIDKVPQIGPESNLCLSLPFARLKNYKKRAFLDFLIEMKKLIFLVFSFFFRDEGEA